MERRGVVFGIACAALAGLLLRMAPVAWPGGLAAYGISYDEGVYFSASALLARGVLPYRDYVLVHPPGLPALLSPLGALAWRWDPAQAFALARAAALCAGLLNVVLVGRLSLRLFGPFAAVAAALLYATHPEAVREERGPFLEPFLNALCLGLAWLWLVPGRQADRGIRALLAGFLGGLAIAVKTWGALWLVAALATPPSRPLRGSAALALGAAAVLGLAVAPFALADSGAFLAQVVALQALRPPQGLADPALRLAHLAALSVLAIPGVVLAIGERRAPGARAGIFFSVAYLATVAAFLASPVYFLRYASHLAATSSVLGGLALARLARSTHGRGGFGAAAPGVLALVCALQAGIAVTSVSRYRAPAQAALATAIRAEVPPDSCLFSMEPGWGLAGGRLPEPRRGVPLVVDPHAWRLLALAASNPRARPRSAELADQAADAAARPDMRRLLERCRFLTVGHWGLAPETRSWLVREWTPLHRPRSGPGPELWRRGQPP